MKKALLIASVLFIAVISTACINNIAVQELNNKAAEYMQKGDYEEAMNRLQASLDLDATMYETYYNLGIAAMNAHKYEKAIKAFEDGIKIKPDFADFYYSLGLAQTSYADEMCEIKNEYAKTNESNEQQLPPSSVQENAVSLKQLAYENLKKYLELSPNSKDKQTVEALMQECEEYVANKNTQEMAVQ